MRYLVVFFLLLILSCGKERQAYKRPNIVFIMADDHANKAISAYDTTLIRTPNIDRIAHEGVVFNNASVTNAICAPSRAVILTGMHSHLNGKIDNLSAFDTTNVTFPQLLQKAGYQTAMFGKLHFGNNPKGFDEFMILPGQGSYYNPDFITKEGDTTITGYVTDIITDLTLNWLENDRELNKPFLLMYLHKAPHRAWYPAERHLKEFTSRTFPLPETLDDNYQGRSDAARTAEMGILNHMLLEYDNKVNDETLKALNISERRLYSERARMTTSQREVWDKVYDSISATFEAEYPHMDKGQLLEWKYQRYMQDYLGTIAALDENVGRLLNYLDDNDLSDNTLVVYTSDQGFYLGEHGWFDKRFMYNESFKTPLLIKWPNQITPGITREEMVQNLDFAQTFLDAAGIAAPENMQGESLMPLLAGEEEKWQREAVYYHYYEYPAEHAVKRHYGMASEDFKLIHFYHDIDAWELYDRKNDPLEMNNVYDDPRYQDTLVTLKKELAALRKKYKDSDTLDSLYISRYNN